MKTTEELQRLKDAWLYDPCWDIEESEGFEDHKEELYRFRMEIEAENKKISDEILLDRSIKLGIPGNIELVKHLERLEFEIEQLKAKAEQ
jgi:hypothetical protein